MSDFDEWMKTKQAKLEQHSTAVKNAGGVRYVSRTSMYGKNHHVADIPSEVCDQLTEGDLITLLDRKVCPFGGKVNSITKLDDGYTRVDLYVYID